MQPVVRVVLPGQCKRVCEDRWIAYHCKECEVKWQGCEYERLCWDCAKPTASYRRILVDNEEVI